MKSRHRIRGFAVVAALLSPTAAHAHLVDTGLGPFYDGVSHLLLTPEDVLPAIALAFLAGLRGARTGRLALFALPVALSAALVVALRAPWSRIAVRVAGSWIVASGLLVLGRALRA